MLAAVDTGVPAAVWLDDPRALMTCLDILRRRSEHAAAVRAARKRGA